MAEDWLSVDNLIANGVTPEMEKTTNDKFKKWDDFVSSGGLDDENRVNEMYKLLNDPTIWYYALFREANGKRVKVYPYQDMILNDDNQWVLVCGSNQCLEENSKIHLADGTLKPIKDIEVGDEVFSFEDNALRTAKVTHKFPANKKLCYKITTKTGKSIICSAEHKFLTKAGWKTINDGIEVYSNKKHRYNKTPLSLLLLPKKISIFDYNLEFSNNKIILLTDMITDGYCGNKTQSLKYTNNNSLLLLEFERALLQDFNMVSKRYVKNNGFDLMVTIDDKTPCANPFREWLKTLIEWKPKKERGLPEIVWKFNYQQLALFLNRLWANDGNLLTLKDKRGRCSARLVFYSPSLMFIDDLKYLLLKIGVHSHKVIEKPLETNKATQNGYRLVISNYYDILNFFDCVGEIFTKESKCREIITLLKENPPKCDLREKQDNGDYFWDYITNIEVVGEKTTYDIEVAETQNFICEGIVTHNSGKSRTLIQKALHFALRNPATTTLLVSLTMLQSKDLVKQMKDMLKLSVVDYKSSMGEYETRTEIYFKHFDSKNKELIESRIICAPLNGSALGFPVHMLLLDEIGFWENSEHMFEQVLLPRTYHTNGKVMAYSNPNGRQGVMWKLWNSPDFAKYRFNFFDCPVNNQEKYDKIARNMALPQIQSTMLAEFGDTEGAFLTADELKAIQEDRFNGLPPKAMVTQQLWISLDFAKKGDRTVRCTGIPTEQGGLYIFEIFEYPEGTSYDNVIGDLLRIIDEYGGSNIAGVVYDQTGVGLGVEDFMKEVNMKGVRLLPVTFTLPRKSQFYTMFKILAEKQNKYQDQDWLRLPYTEQGNYQLSKLRFKVTTSGNLQVSHEKESDRDDIPDSLGILIYAVLDPEHIPATFSFVPVDEPRGSFSLLKATDTTYCICGNILEEFDIECTYCGKKQYDD